MAHEVNELRIALIAAREETKRTAELLQIERDRADMWELHARSAWKDLAARVA